MQNNTAKIKKFSKVIYVLLKILFILCIVACVLLMATGILSLFNPDTNTIVIAGREIELFTVFSVGYMNVNLPVGWEADINFLGMSFYPAVGFYSSILSAVMAVGTWFTMDVFKKLKEDASPFRSEVVRALKKTAVALLFVGIISGAMSLIAAAIVWLLSLIFEYGAQLQQQADETI
ncbi:MAG: hypothetical protein FWE74_09415 [Oscillospiraceae bacterium]|nr:hypothetical protein [Oscillospiraceae bacterium]